MTAEGHVERSRDPEGCSQCGQTLTDWFGSQDPILCGGCRAGLYGGRTRSVAIRLFEPAPTQMAGQTTIEGMDR